MTMKLYELCGADETNLFSPHCWKTRLSLAHKGLDFESAPVPFTGVATIEGGENRKVPVLRDGDTVVEESMEIALYLDKTYPDAPSLFKGEGAKAMTRLIITWSQSQIHPIIARMSIMDIFARLAPADQQHFRTTREKLFGMTLEDFSTKMAATPDDLKKAILPLEMLLRDQPYIGGDTPLFADYVVFGPLQWLRTMQGEQGLPQDGTVADWFGRLLDMYDGMGRAQKAA
ncbi:MAG: glutathione S-transferase family protein [Pseudomonadota bacterium]